MMYTVTLIGIAEDNNGETVSGTYPGARHEAVRAAYMDLTGAGQFDNQNPDRWKVLDIKGD